jgi:hypothetical protein
MSTSTDSTPLPIHTTLSSASVSRFYELNDDLAAVDAVTRRVFFEFLRTAPTLTQNEVDILWSVSELLAGLAIERLQAA